MSFFPPSLQLRRGIRVNATHKDPINEKVTVKASSLNNCPAIPTTKTMGRNTAIVVSVEATIALDTSSAPSPAASSADFPSSLCLKMFSITTIALSTSIPTPSANPPSDIMFIDSPPKYMNVKTTMIDIGMLNVTIAEALKFLKNTKSTRKASTPPCKAASRTPSMASCIKRDWS